MYKYHYYSQYYFYALRVPLHFILCLLFSYFTFRMVFRFIDKGLGPLADFFIFITNSCTNLRSFFILFAASSYLICFLMGCMHFYSISLGKYFVEVNSFTLSLETLDGSANSRRLF